MIFRIIRRYDKEADRIVSQMKTFVLKVIGITLLAIFAVAAITYAAFAIFSPSSLASFYDGIGDYDKAVTYSYGNYERTGKREDLIVVCRYALKSGDDKKTEKYLGKLVDDEFYSYCISKEDLGTDYYDFITGKLAVSIYRNGSEKTAAADKANELTKNYSGECALRAVMFETIRSEDRATVVYINGILSARSAAAEGEEKTLLESDVYNVNAYLG